MSFTQRVGMPGASAPLEDLDEIAECYARDRAGADSAQARRLRDEMICAALPMARRLALRYRGGTESIADLEQVARLGLVKVVDRYAPDKGSFTAYAMHTILGELKRHLRDRSWVVHVPRSTQELAIAVIRHEAELTRQLGRRPSETEVADHAGVTLDALNRARTSAGAYRPISLNMPIGDGDGQLGDLIGEMDAALEKVADRLTVADLLAYLPGRERFVVVSTFYGDRSQASIAAQIGVSQMQVSRILSRVLTWLREGLLTDRVPHWPGATGPDETSFTIETSPVSAHELEIRVAGEVDRDNAGQVRTALLEAICRQPAGQRITLRLNEVPLLDAAGIRVLLAVYEAAQARGVAVTVTGLNAIIRKVAAVAGLTHMLAPAERA
jgi:RNA polymerase sigma-B factor